MKHIVRAALVSALYFALTVLLAPISYGVVQFRISEALCILPLLMLEAAIGVSIGCLFVIRKFIKNDAAKIILGVLPHIIINSVFVPMVILGAEELKTAYIAAMLSVALGEAVVLCALGVPLYFAVKKLPLGIVHTDSGDDYDKK